MTTTEKISLTIEKLKENKQKVNVKNILIQSLFVAGGTPSEEEIKQYLKKEAEEEKANKNLSKLKKLCEAVNRRYLRGLNDDDQVQALFKFYEGAKGVYIIVGYDNYNAINEEQKEDYIQNYLMSTQETESRIIYETRKGRILIKK